MGEYRKEKHLDLFRHHKSKHSTSSTEDRKIFRFVSARRPVDILIPKQTTGKVFEN